MYQSKDELQFAASTFFTRAFSILVRNFFILNSLVVRKQPSYGLEIEKSDPCTIS